MQEIYSIRIDWTWFKHIQYFSDLMPAEKIDFDCSSHMNTNPSSTIKMFVQICNWDL